MKLLPILATTFALLSLQAFAQKEESYIVLDSVSKKVFLAKNSEQKRPVASLTKIATAKLVLDWSKVSRTPLTTKIVVPPAAATLQGASPLKLQAGDSLSLRDALYASLLGSDNVAALTLANYVGFDLLQRQGKQGDPVKAFVKEMNKLAKALGMRRTKFVNPHGLNNSRSEGKSTASDLARLSIAAMESQALTFMVKQKQRRVTVTRADQTKQTINLKNTNQLLGKQSVVGLKTGFTASAGQCLSTIAAKKSIVTELADGKKTLRHRELVIVLLGSKDRFKQTSDLITQGWAAYDQWGKAGYLYAPNRRDTLRMAETR